ncbi:MAG: type VI secretion system ATPase TssH, partial [Nitrospirae bacterium]
MILKKGSKGFSRRNNMRMDKLTIKSQEAVQEAQRFAESKGNQELQPEHLLFALLGDSEGIAPQILKRLGIDPKNIQTEIEKEIEKFPKVLGATPAGQIFISPRLKDVIEKAFKEAEHLTDEYVSVEHLLLSLINIEGPSSELLKRYGVTPDKAMSAMREIRGAQRVTDPNPEDKYQAIARYSRDLTELAKKGRLDPVIGRDDE